MGAEAGRRTGAPHRGAQTTAKATGDAGLAWRKGEAALQYGHATPSPRRVGSSRPCPEVRHAAFPAQQAGTSLRARER